MGNAEIDVYFLIVGLPLPEETPARRRKGEKQHQKQRREPNNYNSLLRSGEKLKEDGEKENTVGINSQRFWLLITAKSVLKWTHHLF